jgi:RNA polymerase sigma factor (sigma-70 family)
LVLTVARRAGLAEFEAEDCAQHTWLALFRHRKAIKEVAALPAWLIQTTHREAVRISRSRARDALAGSVGPEAVEETLPDDDLLRLERLAALEAALAQLDTRCATILRLMFLSNEDVTYRDIAERVGVSPNALGPLRLRCLKRLRKILKEMGFELH